MKILLCCEFYAPSIGGVQEVIRQLAERFVLRGHSVTVATTAIPTRGFKDLNGVHIQEFTASGNLARGMTGDIEGYRQFVTGGAFDVVMIKAAQQWTFDALWPVLSRIPGGKIFIPCGFSCLYEPEYADYFLELPVILKQFDHLIFYTSEYRDIQFARAHGITEFSVIPNGASEAEFGRLLDHSFRRRYGLSDQDFLFLTVGSPARMKGHHEMVEAFALADFSGCQATLLLNAGASLTGLVRPGIPSIRVKAGEYWRAVRRVCEVDGLIAAIVHVGHGVMNKMGIRVGRYVCAETVSRKSVTDDLLTVIDKIHAQRNGKRVVLADLSRSELIQAYMNSDLFVFASRVEYSPLVLFESAAAGTPFLSVPVGNSAEIAAWTGAGVICPATVDDRGYTKVDPEVLGAHWSSLVKDRVYLRQLGAAGRKNWAAQFTWDKITSQYEDVFRKVVTNA